MLDDREQERFMRFWTSAQPSVAGYIHSLVRDHAKAKDLIQETALVLFRRFAEYDGQRPFVAWAIGIARFQVMGLHRDTTRSLVTFDEELLEKFTDNWTELTSATESTDRSTALQECLGELTPRSRHIIRLRYYVGLNAAEIAEQSDAQVGAMRVTLQRIRDQLKACVQRRLNAEGGAA